MNENLLDFFVGNVSVIKVGNTILSSETAPNGSVLIHVTSAVTGNEIRSIWTSSNDKPRDKPKTMGGKQPYLMVMINEIEVMKKSEFTAGDINEQIGYLCCLGKNIEWNTGKLINTKTKQALKYNDLMKLFKCSNKKLNRLIGQMKENEIIYGTAQGYYVSRRFVKKGKKEGGC